MATYKIFEEKQHDKPKQIKTVNSSNPLAAIMEHVGNREILHHHGTQENYQVLVKFNESIYIYIGVLDK